LWCRYERHEASKLGETPLPPFQNQEQLDMTNDFKPFRVYLSALIKAKPAQAQVNEARSAKLEQLRLR